MIDRDAGAAPMPTVCVVTGGGRGIGRAVAVALGESGMAVCVNDTGVALDGTAPDVEVAETVAAEIRASGGRAMAAAGDARSPDAARVLVEEVRSWAGAPPTVLVHAAGVLRDAMVHRASDEDWEEVLGSHLGVAIQLSRAIAPSIRAAGWGRIVYVGGAAGLVGSVGQAPYDVAKAGLFGLTRALALELARVGACVNYVAPFAFTRMTESIPPATEQLRSYLEYAPLATAGDVAPLVAWLCSPDAAGLTGQILGIRGAEVSVWSQPRPLASLMELSGWDAHSLTRVRAELDRHLTPLESEFDLLGGPPVAVAGRKVSLGLSGTGPGAQ
jgi:NAD(P)-dependent dehydrogenase (short-subunit alcohol dehydrogenase family)